MEKADTLLFADWVIPVIPAGQVLKDHAVAITNGRISAVLEHSQARELDASETFELRGMPYSPGW